MTEPLPTRARRRADERGADKLARLGVLAALVSRLLGRLVGVLFVFVLARTSSDATVAGYGYLLGTSALILTVTDLGVASIAGREVANKRWPAEAALAAAIPVQSATILGAGLILVFLVAISHPRGVDHAALLLTLGFMCCNGMVNLWAEVLRARGQVVAEGVLQTLSPVMLVVAGIIVATHGGGTAALLAVVAGKEFLILLASIVLLRPRRTRGLIHARDLISASFTLSVASTAVVILWRQGTLVTGARSTALVAAAYIVATRFQDAGVTLSSTVGFGVLPGAAAARQTSHEKFAAVITGYIKKAAVVGLLAGGIGVVFARPLTLIAFGDRWSEAVPGVQAVAASAPAVMVLYLFWTGLLILHQEMWLLVSGVISLIVGVGVTWSGLLLTGHDLFWAAWGTTAGVYMLTILLGWQLAWQMRYQGRHARGQ